MSTKSVGELSKSPIRSVSRQFSALQNLNVKLKMYGLGSIGMTTGKGGDFYYFYMDQSDRSKTKTRTTLKGIMKYATTLLVEKETENHGD